jgi:hypothetical protein
MTEPIKAARRPRKSGVDKAIANLDAKIAAVRDELKALELARQHMVDARAAMKDTP